MTREETKWRVGYGLLGSLGVNGQKEAAVIIHAGSCPCDFEFPKFGWAFAGGAVEMFVVWQIPLASEAAGLRDLFSPNGLDLVVDLVADDD